MLKLTQNDVTIEVINREGLDEEILDAVVVPATEEQRRDLGKAAVGQAWMAWSPIDSFPKVIKFMLPKSSVQRQKLLKCYRLAIRVADNHEVASVVLPLPEQAGLVPLEDALAAELSRTLLELCQHLECLRHLQLLASGDQEAAVYADYLVAAQAIAER